MEDELVPIYFDMDGVTCDFDTHYTTLTGVQSSQDEPSEITWARLDPHPTFFLDLPWIPGTKHMLQYLHHAPIPYTLGIMSAATRFIPQCTEQKYGWLRRELPWMPTHNQVVVARKEDKAKYARPGAILVDDLQINIDRWIAAGGTGVLFQNVRQTMTDLQEIVKAPPMMFKRTMSQLN